MRYVLLRTLKNGDFFRLVASETATIWVKSDYCRQAKRYITYAYFDVNHERLVSGDCMVAVDFDF